MKTRFKGTKGKWELESRTPTVFPYIKSRIDKKALAINVMLFEIGGREESFSASTESIANAVLISKAPEMILMLEEVNKFLKTCSANESAFTLKNKVNKLIIDATKI